MFYLSNSTKRRALLALAVSFLVCAALPLLVLVSAKPENKSDPTTPSVTEVTATSAGEETRIRIRGTAPLAYSVSHPDARTILIDLLDVNAAELQRYYSLSSPLVEGVIVERESGAGGVSRVRLRILLRSPARDRVRPADNELLVELRPNGPPNPLNSSPAPATSAAAKASAPQPGPIPLPAISPGTIDDVPKVNSAATPVSSTPARNTVAGPAPAMNTQPPETSSGTGEGQSGRSQQQQRDGGGGLNGQVVDQLGGLIVGATVTIKDASGAERTAVTDENGRYSFNNLPLGPYTLRAAAPGFADFEDANVSVKAARNEQVLVKMNVTIEKQEVLVASDEPTGNSLTTLVLQGKDLERLPIGPGGLTAALRALAIPSTGPDGPQVLVDGFNGGKLPNVKNIREIRINQNPYSAEYARPGFGRIEILTKPGTDTFQFGAFFNFNDESLNSRNPFASSRAAFQSRLMGGSVSGPIMAKRSSFFLDFDRYHAYNNALINATVLNSALAITPYNRAVVTPLEYTSFSPRVDFQLNKNNTLIARYSYYRSDQKNQGVGDFSLESRALTNSNTTQAFRLSETAVLSRNMINEIRFQYTRNDSATLGDNSLPTILVPQAFTGGGAPTGSSSDHLSELQLQDYTSISVGKHFFRFGEQFRNVRVSSLSQYNFNGTFTFAGVLAPQLDASNHVVVGANGQPVLTSITGIEQYRRTLFFERQGLGPAEIRALGGGATQFSIAGGDPQASVSQSELGAFVQDDWKLRPNFSINWGLRYETQNNIHSFLNFAPRFGFAWSPGGASKKSKTVLRGGVGIFYNRFSENYTLAARRYNGLDQRQYVISDPAILDLFPTAPSLNTLAAFVVPQAVRRVASDLSSPYSVQASFTFERQLPHGLGLAATFIDTRSLHLLRSRNINAPVVTNSGARPFGNAGEIYEYESDGRFDQKQLSINLVSRLRSSMMFWATYVLSKAEDDTDGAEAFPAYSYDLRSEMGRSSLDARHSFYLGGWISAPFGINLSPLVFLRSGLPFNITVGRDINGDSLYTERPAFATDLSRPSVVLTRYGAFDLNPMPGQTIIPRNYGNGPAYFSANLGISRSFSFGQEKSGSNNHPQKNGPLGGWLSSRPYSLTVSVQIENLFNHTNPALPVGNLSSPLFGLSTSSAGAYGFGNNPAGNRRIELQIYFNF